MYLALGFAALVAMPVLIKIAGRVTRMWMVLASNLLLRRLVAVAVLVHVAGRVAGVIVVIVVLTGLLRARH